MFCRVAGCVIAFVMLVSPAASGDETVAVVAAVTPAVSVAPGAAQDQASQPEEQGTFQPKEHGQIYILPEEQGTFQPREHGQIYVQLEEQGSVSPSEQLESRTNGHAQAPVTLAALDLAKPPAVTPPVAEPFGLAALPVDSGSVLTKWNGVEADIRSDDEILARCRTSPERCPDAARNFLAIIDLGRKQSGRARIGTINRAINFAIRPMSDLAQWGVPDRWSSPLETFTTGRGDCEDYAIAKYVALTQAGIAAEDVRLVIVHDLTVEENHAVAAVRLDGDWIVLDNRWLTLVADVDVLHMVPLFVLDDDGVKQFAPGTMSGTRRASTRGEDAVSAPGATRAQQ